ncbi:aspartyl-tRNA synthetase [Sinobaca qinghaiensis]|uniref:Aspartate--tRNA ligase n=1 Tax=Sinobaca qinghaiensis TaxID=342944 RepID=A0A419V3R3_9BACL|nr:aspartate--tRNA ligase [Sinobaca qinghaiensis]RKD73092.1 aspartyl-tRNA synthetase [Sinobaca qinghaiensis]
MGKRTHYAGDITESLIGEKVRLKGWAQTRRDLGQVIFIDLRDRSGIVQIVANPEISADALETADSVRSEYVLEIYGTVVQRDEETYNEKIPTGTVEIRVEQIDILNTSKPLPFQIDSNQEISEDVRLKYRYLDLRREEMRETIKLRNRVTKIIRDYMDDNEFVDIETPMLTKSTPEGARDYLVPSRVHKGEFYALPQSPQLFKQLLMVSGFERYYQIVRCFRDEDLRADRQPEFTQLDIEASFLETEEFLPMIEELMKKTVKEVLGKDVETPFPRMTYEDAMNRYGSDKPDTRFGLELTELSHIVGNSDFKVFAQAVKNGGIVKGLNVKGAAPKMSRKEIDELADFAAIYGAKGLAWLRVEEDMLRGPIAKFFTEEETEQIKSAMDAEPGDLLFFGADKKEVVYATMGALRLKFGKDFEMIDESKYNFLWVTEFPLVEYDDNSKRYTAMHHPFTSPLKEDAHKLDSEPENVRAEAYDIVLNGYEIGGGSQRIYKKDMQQSMFKALGFSQEEAQEQFGFLLDAFEFGTPPHGGIALGLDRFVMILAGRDNLRDTIAFPKTASASDPLTGAPGAVSEQQLKELHLKLAIAKKEEQTK